MEKILRKGNRQYSSQPWRDYDVTKPRNKIGKYTRTQCTGPIWGLLRRRDWRSVKTRSNAIIHNTLRESAHQIWIHLLCRQVRSNLITLWSNSVEPRSTLLREHVEIWTTGCFSWGHGRLIHDHGARWLTVLDPTDSECCHCHLATDPVQQVVVDRRLPAWALIARGSSTGQRAHTPTISPWRWAPHAVLNHKKCHWVQFGNAPCNQAQGRRRGGEEKGRLQCTRFQANAGRKVRQAPRLHDCARRRPDGLFIGTILLPSCASIHATSQSVPWDLRLLKCTPWLCSASLTLCPSPTNPRSRRKTQPYNGSRRGNGQGESLVGALHLLNNDVSCLEWDQKLEKLDSCLRSQCEYKVLSPVMWPSQHNDHVDLSTREHESNLSSCSRVEGQRHITHDRRKNRKKSWRFGVLHFKLVVIFLFTCFSMKNRGFERHALFHTTPVERHAHNTQHTIVFAAHFLVSTCSRWVSTFFFFFFGGRKGVSRPIINMLKPICGTWDSFFRSVETHFEVLESYLISLDWLIGSSFLCGGAGPFSVGEVTCLVNFFNDRYFSLRNTVKYVAHLIASWKDIACVPQGSLKQ